MSTEVIVSAFQDKGTPKTGLTPAITIYDLADNSVVVNAAAMSEVANGMYKYSFATYDAEHNYGVYVDGGATLLDTDRYQYFGGEWKPPVQDTIVEGTITMQHVLMAILAEMAGKATGGGTATITYRNPGDTKDRVIMTVDANGNRSAVVTDYT
jgi:hypothetical protein